jgi:ABC-type multidrug transport system fused ATPase/permease subunit
MFITYIVFFFSIIQPTKAFASAFYNIQKGLAAMERVDRILDTKNPIVTIKDPFRWNRSKMRLNTAMYPSGMARNLY